MGIVGREGTRRTRASQKKQRKRFAARMCHITIVIVGSLQVEEKWWVGFWLRIRLYGYCWLLSMDEACSRWYMWWWQALNGYGGAESTD